MITPLSPKWRIWSGRGPVSKAVHRFKGSMREQILELERRALQELESVPDLPELERIRVVYLGKKGALTALLKGIATLPAEEKPEAGKLAHLLKSKLTKRLEEVKEKLLSREEEADSFLDITLPGREPPVGPLHPVTH